jgi:hypothetical protein
MITIINSIIIVKIIIQKPAPVVALRYEQCKMRAANIIPILAQRTPLNPIKMPSLVAIVIELAAKPAIKATSIPTLQQHSS